MSAAAKPCRLEIKTGGAWRLIGRFNAADAEAADAVMDAAEQLAKALDYRGPKRHETTVRVSRDDALCGALMYWTRDGGWCDAKTGGAT